MGRDLTARDLSIAAIGGERVARQCATLYKTGQYDEEHSAMRCHIRESLSGTQRAANLLKWAQLLAM